MKYLTFWDRREIHLCVIVGMGLAVPPDEPIFWTEARQTEGEGDEPISWTEAQRTGGRENIYLGRKRNGTNDRKTSAKTFEWTKVIVSYGAATQKRRTDNLQPTTCGENIRSETFPITASALVAIDAGNAD